MFDKSRIGLYRYLHDLFYDVVTKNVYEVEEPQELTASDTKDGFIVIRIGDVNNESEFDTDAYGWARVYVTAYVPTRKRGRLDMDKYEAFENGITTVVENASNANDNANYHVMENTMLSMDGSEQTNADNFYLTFIKSFLVYIVNQQV